MAPTRALLVTTLLLASPAVARAQAQPPTAEPDGAAALLGFGAAPRYGARWGLEVHAIARLLRLGKRMWLSAYAVVGVSTSTVVTDPTLELEATYGRKFVNLGLTPIDLRF